MRLVTSFAHARRSSGRIAALTAALLLAASSAFAATVKSVSMKEAGTATQVVIEGDAPLNYHDFTLESPDRIVVDCPGHAALLQRALVVRARRLRHQGCPRHRDRMGQGIRHPDRGGSLAALRATP